MKEVVEVDITHYRFAIRGEHYYGKLNVRTKYTRVQNADGSSSLLNQGSNEHPHNRHELTRAIDSKEARYLNAKDNDGYPNPDKLKKGDLVKRFNDEESVVEAAKVAFAELFDETDVLLIKRDRKHHSEKYGEYWSSYYEFLAGPAHLSEMFADRKHEDELIAMGYLINPE